MSILSAGLAGFCRNVEKTGFFHVEKPVFSAVKTGLAKIVFAGKNRFLPAKTYLPELSSK